ncbi:MAG TPA: alanine racemase [Sphingomonas sp.]|uniref:alanine racemase n=1 Tax=Sphingomonas sp. TaxID=28214 RepID=UPI002CD52181|nr:alanine racemase [Sphingomonas sp.]HMI18069.1 alanine racemase [Sphingomonas sp.]
MTLPPTPCLVLDLDALERNIARMGAYAAARGLALRPHAKTHKSRMIAGLQARVGAVGICCATLHEAEQLAGAAPSILLTSPVVTPDKFARIAAFVAGGVDLAVVVDHPNSVPALAAALPSGGRLRVLVDVDPGGGRTGVARAQDAVALASAIAAHDQLTYGGIQHYCGSDQHIPALADRRSAITARNAKLAETIAALSASGLTPQVVTGGGTGTHGIDAEAGLLTELQCGSYIFMDQDYGACELGGAAPFEQALTVHATVVSANHPGFVTLDAGIKAIASDAGSPRVLAGAHPDSRYAFKGDEFGQLDLPDGAERPAIGSRIVLMPSHCDPTVNLHGAYHLMRSGVPEGLWPAQGRGYGGDI